MSVNSEYMNIQLKKCGLIVHLYMNMFVIIGCNAVGLLLYGTIKYWWQGFQVFIMFPLCALRCGFETLTPLSIAGSMSNENVRVMQIWKSGLAFGPFMKGKKESRSGKYLHSSCKLLKCRSGIFARFDKLVLLATVNICINLMINLLVFNPK